MYSGPADRDDSFQKFLVVWGGEADMVDKVNVNDLAFDLADDAVLGRCKMKWQNRVYHG